MKANFFPSGEKIGFESEAGWLVKRWALPPSLDTSQMSPW